MTATTTLKLPDKLKARIARLAKQTGRSPHSLMVEALEREVAREERLREFVREALAADVGVEEGAAVYRAEDVHSWLERWLETRRQRGPKRGADSVCGERALQFRASLCDSGRNTIRPPPWMPPLHRKAVEILSDYPLVGRRMEGELRELVISYGKTGYIALYRFLPDQNIVRVLAIRHQREVDFPG